MKNYYGESEEALDEMQERYGTGKSKKTKPQRDVDGDIGKAIKKVREEHRIAKRMGGH